MGRRKVDLDQPLLHLYVLDDPEIGEILTREDQGYFLHSENIATRVVAAMLT